VFDPVEPVQGGILLASGANHRIVGLPRRDVVHVPDGPAALARWQR
jgi:hypothetical protein